METETRTAEAAPPSNRTRRPPPTAALIRAASIAAALAGLLGGGLATLAGRPDLASTVFTAGVLPVLAVLAGEIVLTLRAGRVGLDLVAAAAMVAALAVGETLAAAVVALMYAGGQALEAFAEARAGHAMDALLARAPQTAIRHAAGRLETVPVDAVRPGDRLFIRKGDVVPVDGTAEGTAVLDQSAVTGEAMPVTHRIGASIGSGALNVGEAFDLLAERTAGDSTYAGIVRLVEEATRSEAPATRLADRFALGFMALTGLVAVAAWLASGDPVRAVAVLVVATPCPLILAVPVAIVAGLSRAARIGVLVKGGGALEALARARVLVVDKTGTLTAGSAAVAEVRPDEGFDADTVLALAAALDQASPHPAARALVAAAGERGLALAVPQEVRERAGEGVEGLIADRRVRVGGRRHVADGLDDDGVTRLNAAHDRAEAAIAVSVDGRFAGLVLLRDSLRADAAATLARLRSAGVRRIVLATGDRRAVAVSVTEGLGLDRLAADLEPADKVALVREEKRHGAVMMVGDGVNDAPALVVADVGVAMGRGAAASAEAADVVLLADGLAALGEAVGIANRSRTVALQSVVAGIGLSALGMGAAAAGWLPPVQGALLQEAIDVAVILNALRALRG